MLRASLPVFLCFLLLPAALRGQELIDVQIKHAQSMRPLTQGEVTIHRLLGDVVLAHDSAVMFCDSAYVYPESNSFDAFGRVRIRNGSMRIRGDEMHYDGDTGQGAMAGKEVVLHDTIKEATLYSDRLFFDTQTNQAWYTTWGHLYTADSDLKSTRGYYYSDSHTAVVSVGVEFHSQEIDALSDSLLYDRIEERCYFWGRTFVYHEEGVAMGDEGWFDRVSGQGEFRRNVALDHGSERIFADWLYLDREMKFADAKGHVVMEDSLGYNRLYSQRVRYWNDPRRGLADEAPMLWSVDTASEARDTLMVRANQFVAWQAPRTHPTGELDTITYARAEGDVRLFRRDMQLVADSLYYNGLDSTAKAWREPYPYLWNEDSQVSSRFITAYLSEDLDSVHFEERVLIASQDEGEHYNQIAGQNMWVYFRDSDVHKVDIRGDGDVIFFMYDKAELIGVNRIKSPHFTIAVQDRKPQQIVFYESPHSRILPIRDAVKEDMRMYGFEWKADLRPQGPGDILPAWLSDLDFYFPRKSVLRLQMQKKPGGK